jgi:ABC-type transport system involved in multi-copper enzyme maturation permease subunit
LLLAYLFTANQMHSMESCLTSLAILGASDFWLTKWLTPIWLLGAGIGIGMVLIGLVVVLLRALSLIPVSDFLQKNRAIAHVIALTITLALGGSMYVLGCSAFADANELSIDSPIWNIEQATKPNQEQVMFGIATLLLSFVVGWGLVFGSMPKYASELTRTLTEGVPFYFLIFCSLLIVTTLGITFLVDEPLAKLQSIPSLFMARAEAIDMTIDVAKEDASGNKLLQMVETNFNPSLLTGVRITSTKDVLIADAELADKSEMTPRRIEAGGELFWLKNFSEAPPISMDPGAGVYVLNLEKEPAEFRIELLSLPPVPEMMMVVITAAAVFFFGLALIAQTSVAPRLSAVAFATAKSEFSQPLFLVLLLLGLVAIVIFVFLPFYTLGEDTKSLKECGITVILVLAIFQGVWAASGSVADEIEGRTALTVLSKPIQRRSFVLGKFVGIFWVLLLMFFILGTVLLFAVSYKPLFEARETSETVPQWQGCFLEVSRTIPGLVMALMQATVLSAISIAVSTRMPQLANFAICFGIYLVGNLTPTLVGSSEQQFEIVRFVAQLIAVVIPMLDHYSMQAAIDANNAIPFSLLCGNLVYTGLYVALSMFIALLFFEDRDLA